MDIILHVSNKNTFTYDKIKKFYDMLNEAWVGKDVYKTMVYEPYGENGRLKMWRYISNKWGKHFLPRQFFPIFNCKSEEELLSQKDYAAISNYVAASPDGRSIYKMDLNNNNTTLKK
jgi:hypothetical protein